MFEKCGKYCLEIFVGIVTIFRPNVETVRNTKIYQIYELFKAVFTEFYNI